MLEQTKIKRLGDCELERYYGVPRLKIIDCRATWSVSKPITEREKHES